MQNLKTKSGYILRLNRGEEIITTLKDFIKDKKIHGGFLIGLGAGKEITLGFYDADKKTYHKRFFADDHEYTSLTGNISYLDDEPVIHIHAVISAANFVSYSGHLFSGKVSATCEIFITLLDKKLIRKADPTVGLNLMQLEN